MMPNNAIDRSAQQLRCWVPVAFRGSARSLPGESTESTGSESTGSGLRSCDRGSLGVASEDASKTTPAPARWALTCHPARQRPPGYLLRRRGPDGVLSSARGRYSPLRRSCACEDRFVERALRANAESVRRHGADLDHIVAYVCQGGGLIEQELSRPGKNRLASQARALLGWLAAGSGGASLSQAARHLIRDVSRVNRAVTPLERIAVEGGTRATSLHVHQITISQT